MLRGIVQLSVVIFVGLSALVAAVIALRPVTPRPLLTFVHFDDGSMLALRDIERGYRHTLVREAGISEIGWAAGGRWLSYMRRVNNLNDAMLFDLESGRDYLLLGDHGNRMARVRLFTPVWSPDGRILALPYAERNEDNSASGSTALVLSSSQIGDVRFLFAGNLNGIWTPDGTRFVYRELATTQRLAVHPVVCPSALSSCDHLAVSLNLRGMDDRPVGWMPNGDELMMTYTHENAQPALYRLNVVNGSFSPLLDNIIAGAVLVWSPDGAVLAVGLVRGPDVSGVYLVDADGRETLIWAGVAGEFSWTPQGDRLAFVGLPPNGSNDTRAIYVYDRAANAVTRLSVSGSVETSPVWGIFRGREFAWWVVLLVNAVLVGGLWWKGGLRAAPTVLTKG